MRKKVISVWIAGGAAAFIITGCTLNPDRVETLEADSKPAPVSTSSEEETMPADTSNSDIEMTLPSSDEETTQENIAIDITTPSETIEELELPTNEAGEWTDYQLDAFLFDETWPEEHRAEFILRDFPLIYVSDSDKQMQINQVLEEYAKNDYQTRFQILDIKFDLTCTVLNQSRFVSYQVEGIIYHTGGDVRYEPEVKYRYYFTVDRMTGRIINIGTAIGIDTVYDAIKNGRYEVVEAEASVFERFSNELLAMTYQENPMFEEDSAHELDFFLRDGHVNVVLWVGEENGSYAVLKILDEPKIK